MCPFLQAAVLARSMPNLPSRLPLELLVVFESFLQQEVLHDVFFQEDTLSNGCWRFHTSTTMGGKGMEAPSARLLGLHLGGAFLVLRQCWHGRLLQEGGEYSHPNASAALLFRRLHGLC